MFICPYYLKANHQTDSSNATVKIWTAWIFLAEGGTKLWKTDEETLSNKEIIEQYLAPNGFHGRVTCVTPGTGVPGVASALPSEKQAAVRGGVLYYEVNPSAMNMSDFYTWTEFLATGSAPAAGVDIWRPFLWLGDEPGVDDEYLWRAEMKSVGKLGFLDEFWEVVARVGLPK